MHLFKVFWLIMNFLIASCSSLSVRDEDISSYEQSINEIRLDLISSGAFEKEDLFRRSVSRIEASNINISNYKSLTAEEIVNEAKLKSAYLLKGMSADEVIFFSDNIIKNSDINTIESARIKINDMICTDPNRYSDPRADIATCSLPVQAQMVLFSASIVSDQVINHLSKGFSLPESRCGIDELNPFYCTDPTGGLLNGTVFFEKIESQIFLIYKINNPILCRYMEETDRLNIAPVSYSSCASDGMVYRIALHSSEDITNAFNTVFAQYESEISQERNVIFTSN